jgi:ClpP class serine protease
MADVFVNTVAANRDASRAFVLERFGRGDVLLGRAAIDAKMADEIGTFETALSALAGGSAINPHGLRSGSMTFASQSEATAQAILKAGAAEQLPPSSSALTESEKAARQILDAGALMRGEK